MTAFGTAFADGNSLTVELAAALRRRDRRPLQVQERPTIGKTTRAQGFETHARQTPDLTLCRFEGRGGVEPRDRSEHQPQASIVATQILRYSCKYSKWVPKEHQAPSIVQVSTRWSAPWRLCDLEQYTRGLARSPCCMVVTVGVG